jgi:hypothetical protein
MILLTERALNEAFLDAVEESRRFSLPVIIDRGGSPASVMPEELGPEVASAHNRIAELTAEIAKYRQAPSSVNETTPG